MVLWLKRPAVWEFVWETKQLPVRFLKDLVREALRTKKPGFSTETEGFKPVYCPKKTKVTTVCASRTKINLEAVRFNYLV